MCRRPKYFPLCGECESQESFVVQKKPITISDIVNSPSVSGHQSHLIGDIIHTHEQAEEDNLLNGESNKAEHVDLSIQHVNLDQPVEIDIIDSVSIPIDSVSNQFNQTCIFVQQNETVISECDPHHVEINTNQSLQHVNLAHQYGQMDIIDSQSNPIDIVCNPLNQTCSIVQQAETVILDCVPNQVKNEHKSVSSIF